MDGRQRVIHAHAGRLAIVEVQVDAGQVELLCRRYGFRQGRWRLRIVKQAVDGRLGRRDRRGSGRHRLVEVEMGQVHVFQRVRQRRQTGAQAIYGAGWRLQVEAEIHAGVILRLLRSGLRLAVRPRHDDRVAGGNGLEIEAVEVKIEGGARIAGAHGGHRLCRRQVGRWGRQIVGQVHALAMQVVADALAQADDGIVFRVAIQGIGGIERQAQRGRLRPLFALAARQAVELAGLVFKRAHIAAGRIDFQQLQAGSMAFGVDAQGFLEDIFRLAIAAVGNIHVRFGDGVRFIRIEHAGARCGSHAGCGGARTEQVVARFGLLVFRRQARWRRHRRFRFKHGRHVLWRRRRVLAAARDHQRGHGGQQCGQADADGPQMVADLVGDGRLQRRWFFHQRHRFRLRYGRLRFGWRAGDGAGRSTGRYAGRRAGSGLGWLGGRRRALVGHGLALDRHQLFQVADVLFQLLDTGGRFIDLLRLGNLVFLAGDGALAGRLGRRLRLRQFQLVLRFAHGCRLFLDLGRADLASRALRRLRRLGRLALRYLPRQLVAVGFEIDGVRRHDALRFGRVGGAHGIRARHGQDAPRLHAVHVLAPEGIGIGAVQGDEHHVERHARWFQFAGDAAQGVARLDLVFASRLFRRRSISRHGRLALAWLHRRRHLRAARLARLGCVEHERIFAYLASALAAQFQQQIHHRFGHGLRRADTDEGLAVAVFHGKRQRVQGRIEFHVGLAIRVRRRQLGQQAACLAWLDGRQFDLGAQRLAGSGQHGNLAQLGCGYRR